MKSIWVGIIASIFSGIIIFIFATEEMIDRRQLLTGSSVIDVLLNQTIQLIWALLLIAIIYFMTRHRELPRLEERSPVKKVAFKEVLLFIMYGAIILVGGQWIGHLFHIQGVGIHLHGSFYGSKDMISAGEVILWAGYNFLFYVIIPFMYTRWKGYTIISLNLKSLNRRNDALLIVIILMIESLGHLSVQSHFFDLTVYEMAIWGSVSLLINLFGTVLPAMFFIYCFLITRYYRLSGSISASVLLGGVTYAAFHLTEYWTSYDSIEASLVSVSLVFLQFIGPGIIKTYLTFRTGNAWVHVWAYHAVAPHVIVDTPHILHYFRS